MTRTTALFAALALALPACTSPDGSSGGGSSASGVAAATTTETFELEHADARALAETLSEFSSSAKVTADARTNSVTVEASPARMGEIKNLIRTLDRER